MAMPVKESFQSRLLRWRLNFFPAYRRTGARITFIAADQREVRIALPLDWRTRNYVGTTFGGSIYAAIDPILMVMFIRLLGPDIIVWLKSARIQFRQPARSTLSASFRVDIEELEAIRLGVENESKLEREYHIEAVDAQGRLCAVVDQILYFRKK